MARPAAAADPARIGVLILDSIDQPHRSLAGDYPELFTSLLAANDLEVGIYNGRAEDLPDPTECDGWLIPGSRTSVYGEETWLPALRDWTKETIDKKTPLAGVCFGHQLIAQVLGAPVGPAETGWNVGAISYDVCGESPSAPLDVDQFTLLASHQDQVSQLPDGATLIAASPRCPIAAYSVDDHVLCVQAHPEWVRSMAASLYTERVDRLGATVLDAALSSLDTPLDRHLVGDWLMTATRSRKAV